MIELSVIIVYIIVAIASARRQLRDLGRRNYIDWSDPTDVFFMSLGSLALGLAWPVVLPYRAFQRWLLKPAKKDRSKRAELEETAKFWTIKAYAEQDPTNRDLYHLTARTIRDLRDKV